MAFLLVLFQVMILRYNTIPWGNMSWTPKCCAFLRINKQNTQKTWSTCTQKSVHMQNTRTHCALNMLHSEHNTKKESMRTQEHYERTYTGCRNDIWKRFFMLCVLCNSAGVQQCEAVCRYLFFYFFILQLHKHRHCLWLRHALITADDRRIAIQRG